MSEQRLLLSLVTFIGVIGLVIANAPIGYLVQDTTVGAIAPPPAFDIPGSFNYTGWTKFTCNTTYFTSTLAGDQLFYQYAVNSAQYQMNILLDSDGTYLGITLGLIVARLFFIPIADPIAFYGPIGSAIGTYLTAPQMNFDFNTYTNPLDQVWYNVSIDTALGNQTLVLQWDNSTFVDPWDAFINGSLNVFHGIRWIPPDAAPTPALTPLQLYAANIQAVLSFALDPRIPVLVRGILFAPVAAGIGFLAFWIGKTILHG